MAYRVASSDDQIRMGYNIKISGIVQNKILALTALIVLLIPAMAELGRVRILLNRHSEIH